MISVLQVFHAEPQLLTTRLPLESEAQAMMSHFPDSCCFSMMLRYSYTALTVSGTYTDTVTVSGLKVIFKSVPLKIYKPPFLISLATAHAR